MKKLGKKILNWKSGGENDDQGPFYVFHGKFFFSSFIKKYFPPPGEVGYSAKYTPLYVFKVSVYHLQNLVGVQNFA